MLDVERVAQLERDIEASGTSLATLMDRAGQAVAEAVMRAVRIPAGVVVLAGSGNNGGDGWVAARCLAQAGYDVVLASIKEVSALRAEPARSRAHSVAQWSKAAQEGSFVPRGGGVRVLEAPSADEVADELDRADAVVDALLGTGFRGATLRDPLGEWVDLANDAHDRRGAFIVAADAPSGLSAQTGSAAVPCIRADETVTMLALKPGLLKLDAAAYVGALSCASLGIDVVSFLDSRAVS